MKKFLMVLVVGLMGVQNMAQAYEAVGATHGGELVSSLYHFRVDPKLSADPVKDGVVVLSEARHEVTLDLDRGCNCPEGAMCLVCLPGPLVRTAPIVSDVVDFCGVRHIEAVSNEMRADGIDQSIKIIDYSHMTCRYRIAAPVVVVYKSSRIDRRQGQLVTTESEFYGKPFEPIRYLMN
jgi:hypothetical protein